MSLPLLDDLGFSPCTLRVERRDLPDLAAARRALAEVPAEGWVCWTDRVAWFSSDDLADGVPLSAELLRKDGSSLHLRQEGSGWAAWILTEEPGGEHLAKDRRVLSNLGGALRYREYHRREPAPGLSPRVDVWTPFATRFAGPEAR